MKFKHNFVKTPKFKQITDRQLSEKISKSLKKTNKLGFMERYSIFMGKAQLIEMELKGLLIRNYGFIEAGVEKCTLGAAIHKLESKGLRPDFVHLLKELNDYRVEMAHSFLASDAVGKSLIGEKYQGLSEKTLRYALLKAEEVIQVYSFLAANNFLAGPTRQVNRKRMKQKQIRLQETPGTYSIVRLDPNTRIPVWTYKSAFYSIGKTDDELSVVCESSVIPAGDLKREDDWKCIKVVGPLDFSLTGILSSIAGPLAQAKISIFAISTFDTDYVLVKRKMLSRAKDILGKSGFDVQ